MDDRRTTNRPTADQLHRLYEISGRQARPQSPGTTADTPQSQKTTEIEQEIIRRERIRNDDAEQDIHLKRITLNRLFLLLAAETALIFVVAVLQATQWLGFRLQEWSFQTLITATILQITGMLFVAVRYLFPSKGSK